MEAYFASKEQQKYIKTAHTAERNHGRIEIRNIRTSSQISSILKDHKWKNMKSIIALDCLRNDQKSTTVETRYYIRVVAK